MKFGKKNKNVENRKVMIFYGGSFGAKSNFNL
jgi:UDP-N-acetylglucosamine:LPS N-acetylglucosamine transferase